MEVNPIGATRWDERTERMVTLEGLTLFPLSASFTTSYPTWGDERGIFALAEIELVFQDGSTVSFDCGSGNTSQGPDGEGGVVYFTGVYSFDAPLDLTQLDHIQLGNTGWSCQTPPDRRWRWIPLGRCGMTRPARAL